MADFTDSTTTFKWARIVNAETGVINPSAADIVVMDILIPSITARIQGYCGRDFFQANYTDTLNGNGQKSLMLKNTPITAVSSVKINNVAVQAASDPNQSGYLFDSNTIYLANGGAFMPSPRGFGSAWFTPGFQNVEVSYTAGYDSTASPLPAVLADLKMAATEQAAYEFMSRTRIGQKSQSLQGQVVSFETGDWLPLVKGILQKYIRVATAGVSY